MAKKECEEFKKVLEQIMSSLGEESDGIRVWTAEYEENEFWFKIVLFGAELLVRLGIIGFLVM